MHEIYVSEGGCLAEIWHDPDPPAVWIWKITTPEWTQSGTGRTRTDAAFRAVTQLRDKIYAERRRRSELARDMARVLREVVRRAEVRPEELRALRGATGDAADRAMAARYAAALRQTTRRYQRGYITRSTWREHVAHLCATICAAGLDALVRGVLEETTNETDND